VRAGFDRLIDYAGLFPPAQLPMEEAVAEYAAARGGAAAWMLGRFIVPATRVDDVGAAWDLRRQPGPLPLSVILDASSDPRRWFESLQTLVVDVARSRSSRGLRIEALEIPLAPLQSARETFDAAIGQLRALLDRAGLSDLPAYVELPRQARWQDLLGGAMAALARRRFAAKIRCGGVIAEAFPTVEEIATFVAACANDSVAFKATAGLHHPVRHRDPATGFVMHGFLNLVAAATFAARVEAGVLEQIVAEENPAAFTLDDVSLRWRDRSADAGEVARMRASSFAGYGSCSFSEPVEDLTALGVLPAAAA
jgi:hypothetical protein